MAKSSLDKLPVPLIRNYDDILSLAGEGKVFHVNNPTIGTGVTGQTSYAATLSTLTFRNTSSNKIMVPLYAKLSQTGSVAGGIITIHVSTLEVGQFTSGTALTVYNANQQVTSSPSVLAYHTATLPTFTTGNQRLVHTETIFQTVTAANRTPVVFPAPGFAQVRPGGQLDIYTLAATTGPTWMFNIAWAELEV